jgi:hypothetical protein
VVGAVSRAKVALSHPRRNEGETWGLGEGATAAMKREEGKKQNNVKIGKYGNVGMIASGRCFFNFHIFIFSNY